MVQTEQPYVNVVTVMSKKWLEGLPPDLQKIVRDDADRGIQTSSRSPRILSPNKRKPGPTRVANC